MTKGRVLVTGAVGFIGRWSVPPLIERGFEVHAVAASPFPERRLAPQQLDGAHLHVANLLALPEIERLIDAVQPTHLLHFAWNTRPGVYWASPENFAWVGASLHLLRRFHLGGGTRAVLAGSCAEYDWSSAALCREHETALVLAAREPGSPYAMAKAALQRLVDCYCAREALSHAWGRIFLQYGPFEHPDRFVPSIIRALLCGAAAGCTDGSQQRNFLYSADVGGAFAALLDSAVEGPVNIGAPRSTTIGAVAVAVAERLGRPELLRLGARPRPPGDPPVLVPDVTRLTQEVGWAPQESLESGIDKTIAWWRERLAESNDVR